jgi:hypothetical protein
MYTHDVAPSASSPSSHNFSVGRNCRGRKCTRDFEHRSSLTTDIFLSATVCASKIYVPTSACLRDIVQLFWRDSIMSQGQLYLFCVVIIVCNVCFIVCAALFVVFSAWCVILCDMCSCVLCLNAVPLPPGKTPSAVQLSNIKIIMIQLFGVIANISEM